MVVHKYVELYTVIFPIENSKSRDGIQYEGLCPFHDDHSNSFGWRADTGVCFCFVGCIEKGGAYDYAVKNGMDEIEARKYFKDYDENSSPKIGEAIKSAPPKFDVEKEMAAAVETVKNCPDLIPPFWDRKVVEETGTGFGNDNLWWYPRIKKGRAYGIKKGKNYQTPGLKCGVFPSWDIIKKYDPTKTLHIVEGEPDCITALSDGKQAITFTAGANALPRGEDGLYDVKWLSVFEKIMITYDYDTPGEKGAVKVT